MDFSYAGNVGGKRPVWRMRPSLAPVGGAQLSEIRFNWIARVSNICRAGIVVATYIVLGSFLPLPAEATPRDTVIATVSLNGSLFPQSIVLNPKAEAAYVICQLGFIYGIDTTSNTISFTYQETVEALGSMCISRDGQTLYFLGIGGTNTLNQFSLAQQTVISSLPDGTSRGIPAVSPDNSLVYLPDSFATGNGVRVFSTNPFSQTGTIAGGSNPYQAVFTPDGKHAYITDLNVQRSGWVDYVDVGAGTLTRITEAKPGPRFNAPWGIAVSPNGETVYVTQFDSFNSKGVQEKGVVLIDATTNAISSAISVTASGANAANWSTFLGLPAVTPDGKYLYVPVNSATYIDPTTGQPTKSIVGNTVAVINLNRRKVIGEVTVASYPSQVVIAADGKRAYVLDEVSGGGAAVTVIDITGS